VDAVRAGLDSLFDPEVIMLGSRSSGRNAGGQGPARAVRAALLLVAFAGGAPVSPARAETLSETVDAIFDDVLAVRLAGPGGTQHGQHFTLANVETNQAIQQAFTTLIGSNVSNFPLSSTVSGLTFDFSTGAPVATTTSLGPIFAERAQTIGRRRINVGANVSLLTFDRFRGVPTEELAFSFAHQNVPAPGATDPGVLGDNENEFDILNMDLDMKASAQIYAFYATYGVTDRLDVNFAVPIIHARIEAEETATFDSFTMARNGTPNHFFGTNSLSFNQTLINTATGIGDVALRGKYRFYSTRGFDAAVLGDVRLATGDEENFLGTGETSVRAQAILSWAVGTGFNPHINTGFQFRGGETETNFYELVAGFDQKLTERLTFAMDFLGGYEVGDPEEDITFPEPVVGSGAHAGQPNPLGQALTKVVDPTNIPDRVDNLNNGAFGIKWSPRANLLVIANAIVSLNNGGIRDEVTPTFGLEYNF
jgi:hypothetical protein